MADSLKYCQICHQRDVSKPSVVYCPECKQAFCSECKTFHASIQSSKGHVTLSVENYLALYDSTKAIDIHCTTHDEKYQLFCQTDDVPLCLSCMEQHSNCKGVISLQRMMENIDLSKIVYEIEQCHSDFETNFSKIKQHIEQNQENISQTKNEILSDVRKTRKDINEHLDKIENALMVEVNDLSTKAEKQLKSVLVFLNAEHSKIQGDKNKVGILKKQGSNLHTFLALKTMYSKSTEKAIKTMVENRSLDRLTLKYKINDKLSRLSREIQTFGDVSFEKTPCDIKIDNYKERQAQHAVTESKSLDNVNKKLITSLSVINESIYGCDVTDDGKILLTNFDEQCLVFFDAQGKHMFDISTEPYHAFDVTCIDDTTVAVTSGWAKIISIVDISNQTVKKRIDVNVGRGCWGVTYRDGTLLTCAARHGIVSVRLTDDKITTSVQCNLPSFSYITTHQDKLYYTNDEPGTVTCCDMEGNTIRTFKDEAVINYPRGITTDNKGRVYVCDSSYHAVTVLSHDGKQSKQLASKDDGLHDPCAIHFDKIRNNLLVANWEANAFLFKMST